MFTNSLYNSARSYHYIPWYIIWEEVGKIGPCNIFSFGNPGTFQQCLMWLCANTFSIRYLIKLIGSLYLVDYINTVLVYFAGITLAFLSWNVAGMETLWWLNRQAQEVWSPLQQLPSSSYMRLEILGTISFQMLIVTSLMSRWNNLMVNYLSLVHVT